LQTGELAAVERKLRRCRGRVAAQREHRFCKW